MMNWNIIWLIATLASAESEIPQDDTAIQCICTTRICQEMAEPVCLTSGLCYSQYLDRRDGSNPVTKGCVNLKTPLLCENRPPKSTSLRLKWPILLCCRTSMCNKEDLRLQQMTQSEKIAESHATGLIDKTGENITRHRENNLTADKTDNPVVMLNNNNTLSNPTVLAVFCVGLVVLLAIGITGCCVLQRQQAY